MGFRTQRNLGWSTYIHASVEQMLGITWRQQIRAANRTAVSVSLLRAIQMRARRSTPSTLRELYWSGKYVTDEGLKRLSEVLPHVTVYGHAQLVSTNTATMSQLRGM